MVEGNLLNLSTMGKFVEMIGGENTEKVFRIWEKKGWQGAEEYLRSEGCDDDDIRDLKDHYLKGDFYHYSFEQLKNQRKKEEEKRKKEKKNRFITYFFDIPAAFLTISVLTIGTREIVKSFVDDSGWFIYLFLAILCFVVYWLHRFFKDFKGL